MKIINLIFVFKHSSLQGIPNTINSLKTNMKGGIDVTEDIMINLNQDSLNSRKVKIEYVYTIFADPTKSIAKDFVKIIKKTEGLDFNQSIYLGKSINTEDSSYFLTFQNITEEVKEKLLKNLKKVFSPHVEINISQINDEDDINQKLIEQGLKLEVK